MRLDSFMLWLILLVIEPCAGQAKPLMKVFIKHWEEASQSFIMGDFSEMLGMLKQHFNIVFRPLLPKPTVHQRTEGGTTFQFEVVMTTACLLRNVGDLTPDPRLWVEIMKLFMYQDFINDFISNSGLKDIDDVMNFLFQKFKTVLKWLTLDKFSTFSTEAMFDAMRYSDTKEFATVYNREDLILPAVSITSGGETEIWYMGYPLSFTDFIQGFLKPEAEATTLDTAGGPPVGGETTVQKKKKKTRRGKGGKSKPTTSFDPSPGALDQMKDEGTPVEDAPGIPFLVPGFYNDIESQMKEDGAGNFLDVTLDAEPVEDATAWK